MMRNYVALDQIESISLHSFRRYLAAAGWRKRAVKAGYSAELVQADLFTRTTPGNHALQLPLPLSTGAADYKERLRDAVQTLVDSEGRAPELIAEEIQQIGYDIVRSAIPTELVQDDTVKLSSAKAYVNGMRELLASSATTEVNRYPFFQRQLKESLNFADACRFGHTYKGSFGFVLESPVPTMQMDPLFPNFPPMPFERRVVERLARGILVVDAAVKAESPQLIIEGYREGLNANGCEDLADLVAKVSPLGLRFRFHLSPEWKADSEVNGASLEVGPAHVEVCRAAAKELRRNDVAIPALVSGLVIRLQNETDPTDLEERTGAHEVFVLWSSTDFGDIRVKINLTPREYLDAVRAHATGRAVRVAGVLSKYGRQWVLQEPHDFGVREQTELPLTG